MLSTYIVNCPAISNAKPYIKLIKKMMKRFISIDKNKEALLMAH